MIRQYPVAGRLALVCAARSRMTGPKVERHRPSAVYTAQYSAQPRPGVEESQDSQVPSP